METLKLEEDSCLHWSYDEEADVLYISFGDPQPAVSIDMDGVLIRYREEDGEIVGVTIIGAGAMLKQKKGRTALPSPAK